MNLIDKELQNREKKKSLWGKLKETAKVRLKEYISEKKEEKQLYKTALRGYKKDLMTTKARVKVEKEKRIYSEGGRFLYYGTRALDNTERVGQRMRRLLKK
jgi:hypothetical protein